MVPVVTQVVVLDAPDGHVVPGGGKLLVVELLVPALLPELLLGPPDALVEQVDEPDRVARPRLKLLLVLAEDDAERHVVDADFGTVEVAGRLGAAEEGLEVGGLRRRREKRARRPSETSFDQRVTSVWTMYLLNLLAATPRVESANLQLKLLNLWQMSH